MKRIARTSIGWVGLDARQVKIGGLSVTINVFDDEGWEASSHTWGEDWEEGVTLGDAIAQTAGLPLEEARQLADDTLREWERRGGVEEYERDSRDVIPMLVGTFGLAAVGIAAVVAVGVWLATRVF